jgi:hypothetical protein
VLLIHGDDDRNVNFAQTVGLVQLLRARNVYHELIVFPDDVHETLLHSRWLYTFDRMEAFLNKFFGEYMEVIAGKPLRVPGVGFRGQVQGFVSETSEPDTLNPTPGTSLLFVSTSLSLCTSTPSSHPPPPAD